jgi:hypothetical protein
MIRRWQCSICRRFAGRHLLCRRHRRQYPVTSERLAHLEAEYYRQDSTP